MQVDGVMTQWQVVVAEWLKVESKQVGKRPDSAVTRFRQADVVQGSDVMLEAHVGAQDDLPLGLLGVVREDHMVSPQNRCLTNLIKLLEKSRFQQIINSNKVVLWAISRPYSS